jgi:lipopolysaccharide export LptBFGC system permease protein LptF
MAVLMRLISLILIVAALMLLGADAVTSLERGGELTVRSLGVIWGLFHQHSLDGFKSWVQNHLPFMAQGIYSALALPGWAATGVLGVILAFIFGRKLGPE